ncbi:hypothetical protein [Burkholderia cepacia]|uniref:hypothetical protein n=1 Tax=Burkholderia cepacia TaxID=292 RepID=UPI0018C4AB79|nr:hypothetical protein [Burkholderia cepacia]
MPSRLFWRRREVSNRLLLAGARRCRLIVAQGERRASKRLPPRACEEKDYVDALQVVPDDDQPADGKASTIDNL